MTDVIDTDRIRVRNRMENDIREFDRLTSSELEHYAHHFTAHERRKLRLALKNLRDAMGITD